MEVRRIQLPYDIQFNWYYDIQFKIELIGKNEYYILARITILKNNNIKIFLNIQKESILNRDIKILFGHYDLT